MAHFYRPGKVLLYSILVLITSITVVACYLFWRIHFMDIGIRNSHLGENKDTIESRLGAPHYIVSNGESGMVSPSEGDMVYSTGVVNDMKVQYVYSLTLGTRTAVHPRHWIVGFDGDHVVVYLAIQNW